MKGSGKGLGRLKIKHEKGVGCFMVHKSEVGRAWECSKWFPRVLWEPLPTPLLGTMKHEALGASWFPRVGWEGLGKAQNEA